MERYRVMETLLPHPNTAGAAHRGEEGRHIEALLREFLNQHLPSDLRAVSGFILKPSTKVGADDLARPQTMDDQHSRQLDIIIYDFSRFPVFEQFEEFAVLPPEGVIGIVSVKKTLRSEDLKPELAALKEAVELCRQHDKRSPFSALLGFAADRSMGDRAPQKCFEAIEALHTNEPYDLMITEISLISQFTVFKFRKEDSDEVGTAKYVNVCSSEQPHIALQRLINSILSVYYDDSRGVGSERPGFVSFKKGTFKMAEKLGNVVYRKEEAD
ncbi:MAG: DUF6602 domain-containing protein [Pseudomonadota bacterium]